MILTASIVSVLVMLVVPIVLVVYLTRKFSLSWKLALAGALTFIASQILHIPVVNGLTAFFQNGTLTIPDAWTTLFNAVVLGLLAGFFEETARWILFKFSLRNAKTWNEGVLVGAGHGGVESIFTGLLGIATLINMVVMRSADLGALGVPAEQIELVRQQVNSFWSLPFYMGFLGGLERIFAICLHLSLSVMVLYGVISNKPIWYVLAILWHAFVNGITVYLLPLISTNAVTGSLAIEGILGVSAVISLWILFRMRPLFEDGKPSEASIETH